MSDFSASAAVTEPRKKRKRRAIALDVALSASPRETGEILSFGLSKIYDLMNTGELQSFKDGYARRILTSSIRDYIARKMEATNAASGGSKKPAAT